MKKFFVEKGLYAGEMVVITKELKESNCVIAQPIDDHNKDCGEEICLPRGYLTEI
jgi:hypothetical protein